MSSLKTKQSAKVKTKTQSGSVKAKKSRCKKRCSTNKKQKYLHKKNKKGAGFIDRLIDKIPFELHIPTYQYAGPGTKLKKRMERGDQGINPLDAACKVHDIAYSQTHDSAERGVADKILQKAAMERVTSNDASLGERAAALGVAAAMKAKRIISGQGIGRKDIKMCMSKNSKKLNKNQCIKKKKKKNEITFATLIKNAKVAIKRERPETVDSAIKIAVRSIKKAKDENEIKSPRTIKMPPISGGVLPLIPIFAGLGALGSIVGSTAGVLNAINQAKKGQEDLAESKRHNTMMEAIAIGKKSGKGFYLRPNKNGNGFYLSPYTKNR